jgi:hypothetical protein
MLRPAPRHPGRASSPERRRCLCGQFSAESLATPKLENGTFGHFRDLPFNYLFSRTINEKNSTSPCRISTSETMKAIHP